MRNTLNLRFSFLIAFLLFMPMMIHAFPPEGITIRGKVTDEALKEAVPGANVTVKVPPSEQSPVSTELTALWFRVKNRYWSFRSWAMSLRKLQWETKEQSMSV